MSDEIPTENLFVIGARGSQIVIMNPKNSMTPAQALNLAAWLVAMAGGKAEFDALYERVCNT